jgi:succinate-semialdehyde dehydrogenase/glutarate-semialdehyde dehydrogenase
MAAKSIGNNMEKSSRLKKNLTRIPKALARLSGQYMETLNPATLDTMGKVPYTEKSRIPEFFEKARAAQKEWAALPFSKRKRHFSLITEYIVNNAEELTESVSKNIGKSRIDALATEVISCAMVTDWYAKNAARALRPKMLPSSSIFFFNKKNALLRLPLGIVGIISPWNYPLTIPFHEIVMALMAGNAVMLKAAANAVNIGIIIEKILRAGSLPEGLFHHIIVKGSEITDIFLKNKIDKIFFTGSTATGKSLLKKASDSLTPVSLELGGKDPMIVLADADLERAANGACWAGLSNAGQSCAGIERIYVQETVYDSFIKLLSEKVQKLKVGQDSDSYVEIGSLTTQEQLAIVKSQVAEALKKGAQILVQGKLDKKLKGFFFPPTVLANVNHSMRIMREENFGPVLPVMKFESIEEAISLANDSDMALSSSIWTKNIEFGKKISLKLETGVTSINDHLYLHGQAEVPWGGWKNSGMGRTHSHLGLEEMTQAKVINWDILPSKRNSWWYPYDVKTYHSLLAALRMIYPQGFLDFFKSVFTALPFMIKKMFTSWKE